MATPLRRILVVDDSEAFRRIIITILRDGPDLPAISEAADGVEAIELARAFQPDLILLDIGLPKLNGILAAQQIRELAPQSKILMVSQEVSPDIVRAAFGAGASGYVVKTDVGRELRAALEAVLRGERFAGSRLAAQGVGEPSDAPVHEALPCRHL